MLLVLVSAMQAAAAAESVMVERDSPLLASPATGAAIIAQLPQGTAGELIGRKGAWVNLKTAAGSGWVMSFNVRYGGAQATPASGGGSGVPNPFARRKATTTPTIGIRGLEAEDLQRARVDAEQVRLLDGYAASRQDAEEAAQAAGLSAVRIDYFTP